MSTKAKPTPGEVLRKEAAEHQGNGRSAIARANRRRRIYQRTLRRETTEQIAEETGWALTTVEHDLAELRREALLEVSGADFQRDAAEQLAEFAEQRAKILDALACVGPEHRNYPRLVMAWIELTKVRHVFLERAGLRKPLDQGGPSDASDLRGKPTHVIEAEMARISQQLYQRLDPKGYLRAVQEMQRGDVIDIDVPALPAVGTGEEPDEGGGGDEAA